MRECFRAAFIATAMEGVKARMGAGGNFSVDAIPTAVGAFHFFTDNGTPGPHVHRLEQESAYVPGVGFRTLDTESRESRFTTGAAFTKAWNQRAVEIAPAYLGVDLTMEAGRAVDKRVDPLMSREIGAGSREEDMVGWCLERGLEANKLYWMEKANFATREKDPQAPTLAEKLPELKEACDRAKAGFEQRTGQKWYGPDPERMKPLSELKEIGAKRDKDVAEIFQAVKGAMAERQGERVAEALQEEQKAEAKAEAKTEAKTEQRPRPRPNRRPRPRPTRRPRQTKTEAKAEQKAEPKTEQTRGPEGDGQEARRRRPAPNSARSG